MQYRNVKSEDEGRNHLDPRQRMTVTLADLDKFKMEILHEIDKLLKSNSGVPNKKWLKSNEVKKLLGVPHCTLQNMRSSGKLPFTKIGGVFYYVSKDLHNMLSKNKINRTQNGVNFYEENEMRLG